MEGTQKAHARSKSKGSSRWAFDVSHSPMGPLSARNKVIKAEDINIQVLNSQLAAHGFIRRPISFEMMDGSIKEPVLTCILTMLEKRADDLDAFENLTARYRSLTADATRAENKATELRTQLRAAQRQNDSLIAEKTTTQSTSNSHKVHLRELKADAAKAKADLAWIKAQAQSDARKSEKELARLTDRLSKVADEQMRLGRVGIKYANPEMAPKSINADSSSSVLLQETGRQAIESHLRGLETENESLKSRLSAFYKDVTEVAAQTNGVSPSPDVLPSPLQLESSIQEIKALLARAIMVKDSEEAVNMAPDAHDETVAELKQEINEAQTTIGELQKMLQDLADEKFGRKNESNELEHDSVQLELERQKFADASARLANDRAAFEAERVAWLEEKRLARRTISVARTPLVERSVNAQPVMSSRSRVSLSPAPETMSVGMKSGARRQSREPDSAAEEAQFDVTQTMSLGTRTPLQSRVRINKPSIAPRPKFSYAKV